MRDLTTTIAIVCRTAGTNVESMDDFDVTADVPREVEEKQVTARRHAMLAMRVRSRIVPIFAIVERIVVVLFVLVYSSTVV